MKTTTTTHADDKPASDKPARPRKKVVTAGDLVGLRDTLLARVEDAERDVARAGA